MLRSQIAFSHEISLSLSQSTDLPSFLPFFSSRNALFLPISCRSCGSFGYHHQGALRVFANAADADDIGPLPAIDDKFRVSPSSLCRVVCRPFRCSPYLLCHAMPCCAMAWEEFYSRDADNINEAMLSGRQRSCYLAMYTMMQCLSAVGLRKIINLLHYQKSQYVALRQ